MLAKFFVGRPIFAWVIAIVIMLAGTAAITSLPVAQYPDEMGKAAVEMAVKALKGEAVQADVGVRIGLVTRENAAK